MAEQYFSAKITEEPRVPQRHARALRKHTRKTQLLTLEIQKAFKRDKLFALNCDSSHTLICRYLYSCALLLYHEIYLELDAHALI